MRSNFTEIEEIDRSQYLTAKDKKEKWQQFLENYSAANPYSREDEQLRQRAALRMKELTEPEVKVQARVNLRSSSQSLSWNEGKTMVERENFFDASLNKLGGFENEYESKIINGDKVVLDHATGLTWHQSGSEEHTY